MGAGASVLSCCRGEFEESDNTGSEYQPLLGDRERQAVAALVKLFENDTRISFYDGEPLRALTVLARSDVHHLQLSAATAFSEISEYDVRAVPQEALAPVLYLLQSAYADVQQGAASALGNLASVSANKRLIVEMGGLELLVRQMLSPNTEAQINSVGCITNLAADEENKLAIARSGALIPLVRLGRSRDLRVQRNATGALLNMTHQAELREKLVAAGAVAVLVDLLHAKDEDTLYYAITALSNIAVDSDGRDALWSAQAKLVTELLHIMQVHKIKVQAQVALTLRNLASDARFQRAIVQSNGIDALLPLLQSSYTALVVAAAACLRNLSIHADNEDPIICAGLLPELMDLVPQADQPELQCHAIATIRNLAANNGSDKQAFIDAGLFDRFRMALESTDAQPQVLCELAAAFSVFALNDQLWRPVVELGMCHLLVRLLRCGHTDTEYNACLAIGSLAGKGHPEAAEELMRLWPRGLREGLARALTLPEYASSNVRPAVLWVLMALLNSRRAAVCKVLRADSQMLDAIESIGVSHVPSLSTSTSASWSLLPSFFATKGKSDEMATSPVIADSKTDVDDDRICGFAPEAQRMRSLAAQIVALVQDTD
ncbi:Vacuolar protein 8 [Coemansia erecta]|nr:Vacuolar protein 8 [Coemansia erecta]